MGLPKLKFLGLMRALLRDRTANTIVIAAAALVPLLAMVGGGVDASRYYMAAARLQAACDAGALAARRAMTTTAFTAAHNQIALNFFDQNYTNGMYGTTGRQRSYSADARGVVTGTASAVMPTSIMAAFGFSSFNITATCSADINISNTDIMFVLDVTGSMNCPDNLGPNCGAVDSEVSNSMIVGLRAAVLNFYDTVNASISGSAQVRFGAVPYAHTVNVGASLPSQYIADSHRYQSRVPEFRNETIIIPGNGIRVGDPILVFEGQDRIARLVGNFGSANNDHYRFNNRTGDPSRINTSDRDRCQITLANTHTVGDQTWVVSNTQYLLQQFSDGSTSARAGCRGNVRITRPATEADVIPDRTEIITVFDRWRYTPVTVDVSPVKTGGTVTLPTGPGGTPQQHAWNGCIEEASTVTGTNFSPIPANAFDMNINLVPTTEAQRWKPQLPTAVFWRRNTSNANVFNDVLRADEPVRQAVFFSCVPPAFRLTDSLTRTQLQTYVNNLRAEGATYHDIGMIWGARFISPNGIFASANNNAPNGDPISRHIVFMTDGVLSPNNNVYSPYGMEWWDRRVTGGNPPTLAMAELRHEARFQAACAAAKNENIAVWVVAFGITMTDSLRNCASPGRAYEASNNAELSIAFQEIAQKIAALRLTQ
jgi:Flp pilus assembly protein TadG